MGWLASSLEAIFTSTAAFSAITIIVATLIGGLFRITKITTSGIEISLGQITSEQVAEINRDIELSKDNPAPIPPKPFEVTALASYYNQALSRAQISFWFSLVFASIGFGIIIFAFITHSNGDVAGTAIKVAGGSIIDAVSGLFFVQSTNAQKSMGEFFEKLRLDRLNAEAREMIADIEDVKMRDQLRSQLILKYSGIDKLLVGA